jgi:MFS family permease
MAVLALFETLLSPVLGPIVNDLAPDRLRGRYNGVFILAYTTGFAAGPALAGVGLGIGDGTPFFGFLIAAAFLAIGGAAALRRRLPVTVDMIEPERFPTTALQPEIA